MDYLSEISAALQNGRTKLVKELVPAALESGLSALDILNNGLLAGMAVVGEKFKRDEVFVPEVLVAARAMKVGSEFLKPCLNESGVTAKGKVVIGTVKGDLHDIGKNLVRLMFESKGLEVIDLGVDVAPETFIEAAIREDCDIIVCSALLTTTMLCMGDVVKKAEEANIRGRVKIMVGGAPISQSFCDSIGADAYTPDAASAAERAVELIG